MMDNNNLKSYLKKLYEIESFLYEQRLIKQNIEQKIGYVKAWRPQEQYSLKPNDYTSIYDRWVSWLIYIICIVFMGWVGILIVDSGFHDACLSSFENGFGEWWDNMNQIIKTILVIPLAFIVLFLALIFWIRPVAAVLFGIPMGILLSLILLGIIDFILYRKYSHKYADKIQIKNKKIDHVNTVLKKEFDTKLIALKDELKVIDGEIQKTEQIRTKYYNANIIYAKYRNFVAISSFYEYFDSGRCSVLTGHEGAYNIYESEIRQNIIISQLSEVIEQLKKIEENQYMIYNAITDANQKIERFASQLDSSLKKIGNGIDSLNESAQITAYNTRITAQNTEFIKWFSIFEAEASSNNWV